MATGDYTDLTSLKQSLSIPDSDTTRDAWLARMITLTSRAIDKYCRRWFYAKTLSRIYDYQESRKLYFKADVQSITQILHGVNRAEVLDSSHYFLYPEVGPPYQWVEISEASTVVFRWSTLTPQQSIRVDGVFGYLEDGATPPIIAEACCAWIAYLRTANLSPGIKSKTIGDFSVSYNTAIESLASGPPNEVKGWLDDYRKFSLIGSPTRAKG